ncbi:hypothetical protein GE061_013487 [Apolygus lucorum]|uniref:SH3 domain-containing protein n=1 Tax=Apolygus lucorum TaxID=248454 RepID=A0A8S9XN59_APOLU|nr:hypothetical protein GE061_013487 [Apolygus lucorum]
MGATDTMEVDTNVEVLYDFEYATKDGQVVSIKEGEKLLLLKKTNEDWWQVIRCTGRPFYVPSSYVKVLEDRDVVLCLRENVSPASPPKNFTVSVNIKSPARSKTKVMINCDEEETAAERYGKIPPVEAVKKKGDVAEANILDDNMSSSLAELAREIEFRPKTQDRLMYTGSFKTRYERKMPLRQFSGSTPDLTCDDGAAPELNHTKSVEELPDLENNVHAVHPVVPTPRPLGNNIRSLQEKLGRMPNFAKSVENNNLKDSVGSSDSVGSGGRTSAETLGASSTESLDRPRQPPVAKPRRIRPTWTDATFRLLQDEVIYANCYEMAQEVRRRSPAGRRDSDNREDGSDDGGGRDGGGSGSLPRDPVARGALPLRTPPPMSSTPPPLLPSGWSTTVDTETHLPTYINHRTGDKEVFHSFSERDECHVTMAVCERHITN